MKRWTWLEWRGERAHYVEDSWPGCILVEFIDGERQIWPRADCRILGVDSGTADKSLNDNDKRIEKVGS